MQTYKKVQVVQEHIEDVTCNKCEASCKSPSGYGYEGLIGVNVVGGYGSLIGDMNEYRFDLCEKCLLDLMNSFKLDALVLDPDES